MGEVWIRQPRKMSDADFKHKIGRQIAAFKAKQASEGKVL